MHVYIIVTRFEMMFDLVGRPASLLEVIWKFNFQKSSPLNLAELTGQMIGDWLNFFSSWIIRLTDSLCTCPVLIYATPHPFWGGTL